MPYRRLTSNYTSEAGETFEIQGERGYSKNYLGVEAGTLYAFDRNGKNTHDYQQDTIDRCKICGLEEFGVPMDSWQEEEPLYYYTSSVRKEEHSFRIIDQGPKLGAFLSIQVQGRYKDSIRFPTIEDCKQHALEKYGIALDSWTKDA